MRDVFFRRGLASCFIILSLAGTACVERIPTPPDQIAQRAQIAQERGISGREDTPWRRMTDAALAASIRQAEGKVFIGFKDSAAIAGVDATGRTLASPQSVARGKALVRDLGIEVTREYSRIPAVVARMSEGTLSVLRRRPLVEYVEPIFPGARQSQTTTWNVTRVGAPSAWSSTTGSGAKLLIIDSGIDTDHPDLSAAVVEACDLSSGEDAYGHGTAVAGIAAALNNSVQIVGVSYGVTLWSVKDGDDDPYPDYTACGVEYGIDNGAHAINISTGWPTQYTAVADEINLAHYQYGIVVVAAAGNNGGGAVRFPASMAAVIAVSATDSTNALASFSNVGSKIELAAPGTTETSFIGLTTTCLGGSACDWLSGLGLMHGTSLSAPHVAGAAALLKAYNNSWTAYQIRARLALGATDLGSSGRDANFGFGLLNVSSALSASPPSAPSVSISGPSQVRPNTQCTWSSSISGGMSPFTRAWFNQGIPAGTGTDVTTSFSSSGNLSVQVLDDIGGYATHSKAITVSSGAPMCQQ